MNSFESSQTNALNAETPVTEFYRNKNVLITGVTGFVAKSVIEKLLRQTEVNTIYALVREKRGKSVGVRMDEVKKNLVRFEFFFF